MSEWVNILKEFGFPVVAIFALVVFIWKGMWPQYVASQQRIVQTLTENYIVLSTAIDKMNNQFIEALEKRDQESERTTLNFIKSLERRDEIYNKQSDKFNELIVLIRSNYERKL